MNILVCVKQVVLPGMSAQSGSGINRYDEYALEEALQVKERIPGTAVHAVSAGPQRVEAVLRRAMEMGADTGIHLHVDSGEELTPYQAASLIASHVRTNRYDMIFAGVMAEDDLQMQTGPMIAALLDYPYASAVIAQEIRQDNTVSVERECDAHRRQCVELDMPCVLTVQSGINRPRYPSLSNVLRAKHQDILRPEVPGREVPRARETTIRTFPPVIQPRGMFLEGTQREKAVRLLGILHEKNFL